MKKLKTQTRGNGNGSDGTKTAAISNTLPVSRGRSNGNSRPIVITGGAGFIGSNLANRLLSSGHRVRLIDNLSRPGVEKNLRWLIETHGDLLDIQVPDIRNCSAIKSAIKDAAQVYHFAAQVAVTSSLTDPTEDFEINARGTLNLLEAIRDVPNPPPLIFTSTNKVYGNLGDLEFVREGSRYVPQDPIIREHGIAENRALDFHSPYGCSKGAADQYVLDYARTYRLPAAVFRMSCIYGPHQFGNEDQGWVAHFVICTLEGKPITIYGDGMQVRDILFVEDLLDALLLAQRHMSQIAGNAFNIGGGPANTTSLLELIDMIGELHNGNCSIVFKDWRAADQKYYVADTSKFRRMTGWRQQINVADGVRRLFEWLSNASEHSANSSLNAQLEPAATQPTARPAAK